MLHKLRDKKEHRSDKYLCYKPMMPLASEPNLVTEALDVKKYFLDIDKTERYPISFVIKSEKETQELLEKLRTNALDVKRRTNILNLGLAALDKFYT